jgi:hypothetical protein
MGIQEVADEYSQAIEEVCKEALELVLGNRSRIKLYRKVGGMYDAYITWVHIDEKAFKKIILDDYSVRVEQC